MSLFLKSISTLIIVFLASGIGSFFTMPTIGGWYANLNKPFFNPPNWIFGPVWTLLYFMMAIALAIVWEKRFKYTKFGLFFFLVQLLLNVFWSILFFGFKNPTFAFVDILFLNAFIILTIISFWKTSKLAGAMLIPYLIWCSFAMILNGAIVYLN